MPIPVATIEGKPDSLTAAFDIIDADVPKGQKPFKTVRVFVAIKPNYLNDLSAYGPKRLICKLGGEILFSTPTEIVVYPRTVLYRFHPSLVSNSFRVAYSSLSEPNAPLYWPAILQQ